MPKIINDLDKIIFEEVHKQLSYSTYSKLTIRSIAKACGIGIGTVYNYYPSKDTLVAMYLLNDWNNCLAIINHISENTESSSDISLCIYEQLNDFIIRHKNIFKDETAIKNFRAVSYNYHTILRNQLSSSVRKFCQTDFHSEFIAESLLTWIIAGKTFDEIYSIIKNCF